MADESVLGVMLSWDPTTDLSVSTYKVRRSVNEGGPYVLLASPTVPFYLDQTGVADQLYWYEVRTANSRGVESDGVRVQARKLVGDTTPPAAPTGLTVVKTGANSTFLDWNNNIEPDLVGYWVVGATTAGGPYTSLHATLLNVSEFAHLLATAPNTWYYSVQAQDQAGNTSPWVGTSIALTSPDVTPPATPVGLVVSGNIDFMSVFWTANNEPDLQKYLVERSLSTSGPWTSVAEPTVASIQDASASVGVLTWYRVSAFDTAGNQSGYALGSGTRPSSGAEDLSEFLHAGTMVPTVVHGTGVDIVRYRAPSSGSGDWVDVTEKAFKPLASGTPLTARYLWDFAAGPGNPQGLYNDLEGFNAAHAYDIPGSYRVRLTRIDENGLEERFEATVNLASDTRTVVYVGSGSGLATTGFGTPSAPVTVGRAQAILDTTDAVKILLRNGDVFGISGTFLVLSRPNQMVSNYNPGAVPALPKIVWTTANGSQYRSMFVIKRTALNPVFENFSISQEYSGTGDRGRDYAFRFEGNPSGDVKVNALIRNITFTKVGRGVNPDEIYSSTRYLLVQDCSFPLQSSTQGGLQNYAVWIQGQDFVLLGLNVEDSQDEHPVRADGPNSRVLISRCRLQNLPIPGQTTLHKQPIRMQQGRYHYVTRNTFITRAQDFGLSPWLGNIDIGPLGGPDGLAPRNCRWSVFERNEIFATVNVRYGIKDLILRNNYINKAGASCIEVEGRAPSGQLDANGVAYTRTTERVEILNNTLVHVGSGECFLKISRVTNELKVRNNLGVSTTLTGSQVNVAGGFGTGNVFNRNIWGAGAGASLNNFRVAGVSYQVGGWNSLASVGTDKILTVALQPSTYRVPGSSEAATYALPVRGVFNDLVGVSRLLSDANWSNGAVETNY